MSLQLQVRFYRWDFPKHSLEIFYRSNHINGQFRNRVVSLDLELVKELLKIMGYIDDYCEKTVRLYISQPNNEVVCRIMIVYEFFNEYTNRALITDITDCFIRCLVGGINVNGRIN